MPPNNQMELISYVIIKLWVTHFIEYASNWSILCQFETNVSALNMIF